MLLQIVLGLLCSDLCHGTYTGTPNDEDCPRFVYEYKLLEKLVKLELDKTAMHNKVADLEKTCCTVTKKTLPPHPKTAPLVAVKIGLSATKKVKIADRIIYDRTIANEGDAYDNQTGIFKAPVSGVYFFAVSVCLDPKDWMVLSVVRDHSDSVIGHFRGGDKYYHTCTNDYTTVKLDIGDKVWVEKIGGNTDDLNEEYGWNSLSVNLIQPA